MDQQTPHWNDVNTSTIEIPEYHWQCQMTKNMVYNVVAGVQPNRFHRMMQRLAFGFKWTYIGPK